MIRLAAVLSLLAGGAQALSCMAPDVARDYLTADAAPEPYFVMLGTLQFDPALLPVRDGQGRGAANATDIPARLTGRSLTTDGFTRDVSRDVTLRVLCLGPWCAGAESGTRYLAFLRQDGDRLIAEANPCGGMLYVKPTVQQLKAVRACAKGDCTPAAPHR
ncbi:hypothetical protein ACOXXX_14605 [Thalassococcus sp. BH17M4-6]|uniref:hypothetical protein n=1 Tax=Thalassococcus sp. BH17M4-6 TaxID=3413148 RepID=UPI003BC48D8D